MLLYILLVYTFEEMTSYEKSVSKNGGSDFQRDGENHRKNQKEQKPVY